MNVLHLVAGQLDGGAARGAYWLHRALCESGVDSRILTNATDNLGDDSVIPLGRSIYGRFKFSILHRMSTLPIRAYRNRQPLIFSTGLSGIDITRHPAYDSADLVHLHWVTGLVSIRSLRNMHKPLVWTLRDMWPFTGGCHHSLECERFTNGCGGCPQLGSLRERDLTSFVLRHKQASVPKDIRVVGISRWMSERASRSAVFRDCSVSTISNNIDTALFSPLDRALARRDLGLEDDRKVVLVGALDVTSTYKGFDLFLEALGQLSEANVRVVTFGNSSAVIPESLGFPVTNLGFLSDTIALRRAYSAADVFVAPSRADAFGKTLVEAMSCRTPVVSFNATGPKDIVEHKKCGYLAEPFSPEDLAQGIQWVIEQTSERYSEMCRSARARAKQLFDSQSIAQQYLALYEDALREQTA